MDYTSHELRVNLKRAKESKRLTLKVLKSGLPEKIKNSRRCHGVLFAITNDPDQVIRVMSVKKIRKYEHIVRELKLKGV